MDNADLTRRRGSLHESRTLLYEIFFTHMFLQATLKGDVFSGFHSHCCDSLGKTITNDVLLLILKANLKLKNMPLRRKKSVEYDLFRTVCFVHSHIKGCKSLINQLVKNHKIPSQNNLHFHVVLKEEAKKQKKSEHINSRRRRGR